MKKILRNADKYLAALCLVSLILLVIAQIVMRVVFLEPLVGAEELVRYFLICVVFLGASYAARNGGHIRMEEFQILFPKWLRFPIRFLSFAGAVVAFGLIAFSAFSTLLQNMQNKTATLSMPFWFFILPTVLGFTLLTAEYVILLIGFFSKPDGRIEDRKQ